MTELARCLLIILMAGPVLATGIAIMLVVLGQSHRLAVSLCGWGLAVSFLSAICLSVLPYPGSIANVVVGDWLEFISPVRLQVGWGLQIDQRGAVWVSAVLAIAGLTILWHGASERIDAGFAIGLTIAVAASLGVVLATSLFQFQFCWTSVSIATLALVGWSSKTVSKQSANALDGRFEPRFWADFDTTSGLSAQFSGVHSLRRAIQVSLVGDLLLLWAMIAIGRVGHCSTFDELSTTECLAQLAAGNPTMPDVIGCLLVLSVLGRCGLFPVFGWNHFAASWDRRCFLAIYAIAYVPSGLWVLFRFYPLLASSGVVLELMGGLGALGAVLGAFVACGQTSPARRLAFLLTAQTGVLMAALGSGRFDALNSCVWHLGLMLLTTFVLGFPSTTAHQGPARFAIGAAVMSIAGLLPMATGLTQFSMQELNRVPVAWVTLDELTDAVDSPADATNPVNRPAPLIAIEIAPRWGWIGALWLAQGVAAFAAATLVRQSFSGVSIRSPGRMAWFGVALLCLAGPVGWHLKFISIPTGSESLTILGIGQVLSLAGLTAGLRSSQTSPANASLGTSLTRLAAERFYVDQAWNAVLLAPRWLVQSLGNRSLAVGSLDRIWKWLVVNTGAWIGQQSEAIQVGQIDFYLAATVVATASLLATWFLVL